MGFFSGIFGANSAWDGAKYITKVSGQKFWHNGFIDKDNAIQYGKQYARQEDPMGPRNRAQDKHSLMGELIFYFQIYENSNDEKALKYIAQAMTAYIDEFPEQNAIVHFGGQTDYFSYK
jgi:hypothetical protein